MHIHRYRRLDLLSLFSFFPFFSHQIVFAFHESLLRLDDLPEVVFLMITAVFNLHGATQVSYTGRLEHCFGVSVDTLGMVLLCVFVAFTLRLLVAFACR
jgi:hypothetical protein